MAPTSARLASAPVTSSAVADVDEETAPAIGSPEWEAQQLARSIVKQSDALDVVARQQALAQAQPVVAIGDSDLRARMLAEARANSGGVRMGRDVSGEAMMIGPHLMSVTRDREGRIKGMHPGAYSSTVVRPDQWEEHDREWQARVRLEENRDLARYWRKDRCLAAGVITADEAQQLPPDPPPNPNLAPASSINSVG